jgi:uncharacterized membrane protein
VTAFFVASFVASALYLTAPPRAGAGYYDLSVFQQALSSSIHHGPYPFYEAGDCGRNARCSFLLVHPAFLMYGIEAAYSVAPTALTLIALQSFVVALGAVPLFGLATEVSGSSRKGLLAAGMYLAWFPLLSSYFWSFHLEPFLPVELFFVFWMWLRGQYLVGFLAAGVTFISLEIGPVFIFFIGLFFLTPFLSKSLSSFGKIVAYRLSRKRPARTFVRAWASVMRRALLTPQVGASLGLMAASVLAYIALRAFVDHSVFFGFPALPSSYQLPLYTPNPKVGYGFPTLGFLLTQKVEYWIILYALVGFIPLLVPRTIILALPWIGYTFFTESLHYTTFAGHYGVLAAAPLLIGFAYGIAKIDFGWLRSPKTTPTTTRDTPRSRFPGAHGYIRSRKFGREFSTYLTIVVIVVVLANLFLSPLDPLASNPLSSLGYTRQIPYPQLEYVNLERLASLIPPQASVLVSLPLLPLVANDPNAYPMVAGVNESNFPVASSYPPQYILLAEGQEGKLASFAYNASLMHALYSPTGLSYNVSGFVPNSTAGAVVLFQRGYTGPTQIFGPNVIGPTTYLHAGAGIVPGLGGRYATDLNSTFHSVIVNRTGASLPSLPTSLWVGGPVTLSPGSYTVDLALRVKNLGTAVNVTPATGILGVNISGFGKVILNTTSLRYQLFPTGAWTDVSITFSLPFPVLDVMISGMLLTNQFRVELGYVLLSASTS